MGRHTKTILSIVIIVIALLITYNDSYTDHHRNTQSFEKEYQQVLQDISEQDFIQYDHPPVALYQTPDLDLLDTFVRAIEQAKETIRVQVYIFTEKRMRTALVNAHNRGVDVQILLEPFVYGAPHINNTSYEMFSSAGIPVKYASEDNYTFTHSKFMIIDDIYIIGTGNLSYSSFKHNQEFYAIGDDPHIYQTLMKMWEADNRHEKYIPSHPSLITSPIGSREKLTKLIQSAQQSLEIYAQSLSDREIKKLLKEKYDDGISITIYMGNLEKYPANEDDIEELRSHGITIHTPDKPYVHAKAIFVDGEIGYIGSINFTQNSIDNNREVGLLFLEPIRK